MVQLRNIVTFVLVVLLTSAPAFAQPIESVAADYILNEYCFGGPPQEIVFAEGAIQYSGSYALLESAAYNADGSPTDDIVEDLVFVLCFEKQEQWRIVYDLSRSDVPSSAELDAMKKEFPSDFPKSLLPKFWQRLLK